MYHKDTDINTHTQEVIMSIQPKSGFEIRADLLNQAQGILEGNIYRKNDLINTHNDSFPNDRKPLGGQCISVEDVISTAKQLNEFVTENLKKKSRKEILDSMSSL